MRITIETVAHADQRYSTCGDWYYEGDGNIVIRVSDMPDWRMPMLVAIHELVEVLKCKHDGIDQRVVDAFDIAFEKDRDSKLADPTISESDKALIEFAEPGDQASAPYRAQHCLATGVERIMAYALDVTWADYEVEVEKLH
jgi:hypothetical protein